MYHIIHPTYVCYSFILGFTKYFFQYTMGDVFKKEHKGKESVTSWIPEGKLIWVEFIGVN